MQRPSHPTPTTYTLSAMPAGVEGVRATLRAMSALVRDAKKTASVRQTALAIVKAAGLKQKDYVGEARALHAFVRDCIRYVRDVRGVETLHTPEKLLELRQGDCDDKSTLLAALLESIGHPTRLVAVGLLPEHYSHVYPETKIGGQWVAAETTEPVRLGWQPQGMQARMTIYN